MRPPFDLDLLAAALRQASASVDDPGRRVATVLADDPLVQEWAASEALKDLGAPRHAGEMAGRSVLVAVGRHALAMVRGARSVFGATLDEGLVVVPGDGGRPPGLPPGFVVIQAAPGLPDAGAFEAGRRIEALAAGLGARDRLLVLLSEGAARLPALPVGGLDPRIFRRALRVVADVERGAAPAAALRARIDGVQAGGMAALVAPTPILALRLEDASRTSDPLADSGLDPLGGPPPTGRSVEIALRRAGLWDALPGPAQGVLRVDELHPALKPAKSAATSVWIRPLEGEGAGLPAALTEARRRGLEATVLTAALRGDAEAAGRGLARVGRALQDGLGGLALPACALAAGRMQGGPDRHARFARAAETALEGREGIRVLSWTPVEGGTDLCAVLARDAAR